MLCLKIIIKGLVEAGRIRCGLDSSFLTHYRSGDPVISWNLSFLICETKKKEHKGSVSGMRVDMARDSADIKRGRECYKQLYASTVNV